MTVPPPWTPEHPVDRDLAARLVSAQFPDLAGVAPERVGEGWDADVWRFGDLAFRFPRRAIAVQLVAAEARVLPWIARRVPVAVPEPTRIGAPTAEFPPGFYGHPFVPGRTGDRAVLDAAARAAVAPSIAAFLRALHGLDPAEAARAGLPTDLFRTDLDRSARRAETGLTMLAGTRWAEPIAEARRVLATPPAWRRGGAVPLHGDLYARHLVFDDDGTLTGVIDWGDACLGDRALDLTIVYAFLPPEARPAFWAVYGEVDAATRERARFVALTRYGVNLLAYAVDVGDEVLEAEAGLALTHALQGP